jgi:DNA-binding NarL/FixJ family response regulator
MTPTNIVSENEGHEPRTIVAVAARDEALASTLLGRLAAEADMAPIRCLASDPCHLLAWLEQHDRTNVLLVDECLLGEGGARPLRKLRALRPELRVLVLCDQDGLALAESVVRHRFHGLLVKGRVADTCVRAIRIVTGGGLWLPRGLLEQLVERRHALDNDSRSIAAEASLTGREVQVVAHLRRGLSNRQIADALHIREDTVKKHLRNAYAKLGVHTRGQVMAASAGALS